MLELPKEEIRLHFLLLFLLLMFCILIFPFMHRSRQARRSPELYHGSVNL